MRLVPATPTEPSYATIGDTPIIRDTLARLADTGIGVLDVEILRLKPETRVADFAPVLETAARLGARNALVAGNDPDAARFVENFAALCDLAAPYGIAPCVEPMPWTDVRSFAQGAEAVRQVARANAGLLIDRDPLRPRRQRRERDLRACPPRGCATRRSATRRRNVRPTSTACCTRRARSACCPAKAASTSRGIFGALPRDTPVSVEIPMERLARSVPALERARRALHATQRLLHALPAGA